MLKLFQYNWQVRDDWFTLCEDIPNEELLKKLVGGFGSILHTLFHIVDVEYMWILGLRGEPVPEEPMFEDYACLQKVKNLSAQYHEKVKPFVKSWTNEMDSRKLSETDFNEDRLALETHQSGAESLNVHTERSYVMSLSTKSIILASYLYGHVK